MTAEVAPVDPAEDFVAALRRHLDAVNHHLVRIAHGLDQIESSIGDLINPEQPSEQKI